MESIYTTPEQLYPKRHAAELAGSSGIRAQSLQPGQNITFDTSLTRQARAAQTSGNALLVEPSVNDTHFDANGLTHRLNRIANGADIFKILEAVHKLFIEMRRQASESKQGAYQSQWTALEAKAKKLEDAAKKDLAASMVNNAMSFAGGAGGLYCGVKAGRITKNLAKPKLDIETPTLPPAKPNDLAPPATTGPNEVPNNPQLAGADSQQGNTPNPSSKPAKKDTQNDPTDPAAAEQAQMKQQVSLAEAQNLANLGMAIGQFASGLGGMVAAPITYSADLDRAAKELEEAEATKAQADVESEADFVRSASEGLKSIQDFMDQFISARAQINEKIMS